MKFLSRLLRSAKRTADLITDNEWRWWGFGGNFLPAESSVAGEDVSEASLLTSATCFACTKALAETIAGLPSGVYRTVDRAKYADEKSDAHTLLSIAPNPEMDSFTFWELAGQRIVNCGNFFAEIQRDGNDRPIALWPIHPTRVTPVRETNGDLLWEISADFAGTPEYADASWRQQHLRWISPHNMLNIPGFGSRNGIVAPGMLPGAQEIGMDFAIRRYGGSFFRDGAVPVGVVEHPGFIANEAQRNIFRADMNAVHSAKRHQIGVLWQGAKYTQISMSPEQAQFLETRKFTSEQLCKFYGVPPAIIGDYEHSKFATADAMVRAFVMITLRNLAVRIERAINRQVLNVTNEQGRLERAFTKNLIYRIAIDGLLRGDPEQQAKAWQSYRMMGAATANEIRDDIGLNPIEGEEGEYLIVHSGAARLDKIDEQGNRPNNARQSDTQEAKLPSFDRERLVSMLEPMVEPTTVSSTGFDPKLASAAIRVADSAIGRIHKITLSQFERWRTTDPAVVETKLAEFWPKQKERLVDALAALSDLISADLPNAMADAYLDDWTKLDAYDIFDSANHPTFDTEDYLDAFTR